MLAKAEARDAASELLAAAGSRRFKTVMADPPWRFQNSTGKVAPEHRRLSRYGTMELSDIMALPVTDVCDRSPISTSGFPTRFCRKDWRS